MPQSEASRRKLRKNVWIHLIIILVGAYKRLKLAFSQKNRQVFVKGNVLNQTDYIIPGYLENFLIRKICVFLEDHIANTVMLPHKYRMENS